MQYLATAMLCISCALSYGQDTAVKKQVPAKRNLQIEVGASAGFVFAGAAESTLPVTQAFRAGMFLFRCNANLNKKNHPLYFSAGAYAGFMPFSTLTTVPSPINPRKPLAEYRNEYLVTSFALVPSAQLEVPLGKAAKFCLGAGAGPLLHIHAYQKNIQKNILLEASLGIMADDATAIGFRFYRPYNGLEESTGFYKNSYLLTGVLFEFRQRLSVFRQKQGR